MKNPSTPQKRSSFYPIEALEQRIAPAFAAAIDLGSLDGSNGFRLDGIDEYDRAGFSAGGAGDINGDGFDDLIVGAPNADPGGNSGAGESYVVFGKSGGFASALSLGSLDGSDGFRLEGIGAADSSGLSVSGAGDVNADGFDDLIVGAPNADPGGDGGAGESYLVFGKSSGFGPVLDLGSLDGTNGFRIVGINAGDGLGHSVSGAGDVNGDGFDDLIIGALYAAPQGNSLTGASYVVFGKRAGFSAMFDLGSLDGTNGFRLDGIGAGDLSARAVSAAGDVNGDGLDDLVVGARNASPAGDSGAGECYVVFGKGSGFASALDLGSLDGGTGFRLVGISAGDRSGSSVSGAGDVNGDGFDDLIVGAPGADPGGDSFAGESYLVFGKSGGFGSVLDLGSLDGTNGFRLAGINSSDYSGYSVSGAGDVDGDGFDDLIVGARDADPGGDGGAGESYLVFGTSSGFGPVLDLGSLDGTNGFRLDGIDARDSSGCSVSGAGDVNGDGFDDVIVGARNADPGGNSNAGESYVVFGGPRGSPPGPDPGQKSITYTEPDGDRVVITVEGGKIRNEDLEFINVGGNQLLRTLDLTDAKRFGGATITVKVVPSAEVARMLSAAGGNFGIPNIGEIKVGDQAPEKIDVRGDVSALTVPPSAKIETLKVQSLGAGQDLFPGLKAGADVRGVIAKVVVTGEVNAFDGDISGKFKEFVVKGDITGSTFSMAKTVKEFRVGGTVTDTEFRFAKDAEAIEIKGDLVRSKILGGYDSSGNGTNADATIDSVEIGGELRESSIVAGASSGGDGIFGTADDALLAGGGSAAAMIAKIVIGAVAGSTAPGDGFGIVAEQIAKVVVGGTKLSMNKGPANDLAPILLNPAIDDIHLREVAAT